MKLKLTRLKILGIWLAGANLFLATGTASAASSNQLFVVNYTPDYTGDLGYWSVRFVQYSSSGGIGGIGPPPPYSAYFYIWQQNPVTANKYGLVGVNTSSNSVFECPLQYVGSIPDFTRNSLTFQFYTNAFTASNTNTFPKNVLISAKVVAKSLSNAVDVLKLVKESGTGLGEVILPSTSGAVDGEIYGALTMYFNLFETNDLTKASVTNLTKRLDGAFDIGFRVQLGTSNTLYCITNSISDGWSNAIAVTNFYAAPAMTTIDGGWTGMTFTVTPPAGASNAFYRVLSYPAYP